ncbi:ATP-binding protein, partial [Acinetobacter baumannii]
MEKVDPISIDPISMARVIDNLVGNAIKFVPDGGKICVKVWQDDQTSVVLQVTDSGPGISIEEQGNLFG